MKKSKPKIEWKLLKKPIEELFENPKNPRMMTAEQARHLTKSIDKFGLCEPVVINDDGTIIGGHQRVNVLSNLGYVDIDVFIPNVHLSNEECDELNIRLNKNSGEWDYELLANFWDSTDLVDWGFTLKDLHLDSTDEKEESESKKKFSLTITFLTSEDLENAEAEILPIVHGFAGASCKKRGE